MAQKWQIHHCVLRIEGLKLHSVNMLLLDFRVCFRTANIQELKSKKIKENEKQFPFFSMTQYSNICA